MRLLFAAVGLLLLMSCSSSTCARTCHYLYLEDGGCELAGEDEAAEALNDLCYSECADAWLVPGLVGDYDPYVAIRSGEEATLENYEQASLWAECVEETACDRLRTGYCAPIY